MAIREVECGFCGVLLDEDFALCAMGETTNYFCNNNCYNKYLEKHDAFATDGVTEDSK